MRGAVEAHARPSPPLPGPPDRTWRSPECGPEFDALDPEVIADAVAEREAIRAVERDETRPENGGPADA